MIGLSRPTTTAMICCLCGLLSAGCGRRLETDYGRSNSASLNGTGVLAEMFRSRGDDVKTAFRLTEPLSNWADVIVRFSPHPGPPSQPEADWYLDWLTQGEWRRLVYVIRDFDAEEDYWNDVIRQLESSDSSKIRKIAESKRATARRQFGDLGKKVGNPADADEWFRIDRPVVPPKVCKTFGGSWADGVNAETAAILVHECFVPGDDNVMLLGDERPLAIEWPIGDESRVLALANGSFVLNAALVNPQRRRLASRVVDWSALDDAPRRVAFVEGESVLADSSGPPSIWDLLFRVASFRWVAIQMGILGLAACLARAPRLGRPLPDSTGRIDRPSTHAEAIGEMLARSRSRDTAAESIEVYRRWRHGRSAPSREAPGGRQDARATTTTE